MARINKGILGPITGSIANITGYLRLGVPVVRLKTEVITKNRTPKQMAVTLKFRLVMEFIKPVTGFINIGFSQSTKAGQTAHNVAVSHALSNGISGEYPELRLDYSRILVADGQLPPALDPVVEVRDRTRLRFNWSCDPSDFRERKRDQVMLLAYSPQTQTAFYVTSGARRSAGEEFLEIYTEHENQTFETYIGFISDDRKMIAPSVYTGQIIIL